MKQVNNKAYKLLIVLSGFILVQGCKKSGDIGLKASMDNNSSVAVAGSLIDNTVNITSITWGTAKSQPTGTHEINGEVVNNKLYIFGGHDINKRPTYWTSTKRAYTYDPVTNNWSAIADLPQLPNGTGFGGVTNEGLTNDGSCIYFAGGYISTTTGTGQIFATNQVWKYDIALNNYVRLPDLPRSLAVGQLKYLNGKLHFIGGADLSRQDVGVHYALDLYNQAAGWKTLAPLINPVNQGGAVVYQNKIYFMGGSHNHDKLAVPQKTLEVYDETTNKWSQLADMPVGLDHIASAVVTFNNRIFVLGGESAHNVFTKSVFAYSPATNTWTIFNQLPVTKSGGVVAVMDGNIYYTGGNFSAVNFKGIPK